jgi:hypothetical protein
MVDDRPEDTGPSPDPGRARRPPPTIDLEASEISSATRNPAAPLEAKESEPAPSEEPKGPKGAASGTAPQAAGTRSAAPVSPWVVAPVSGAVAAALVIGVGWMLGWPPVQAPTAARQVDAAVIDGLTARIAGIESRISKPVTDQAAAARADALEKSLAALRGELSATRAQSEKLAASVGDIKSAGGPAAAPDLTALNERIAQLENATRVQIAATAQANAKPADDVPLRRIVAAALLDVLVRTGEAYPAALTAAKALSPNAEALKPLDVFAAKGLPNQNALCRELLDLVPRLSPPAQQDAATTGAGLVERLQAGAAKLVRIERTSTVGNDRGAIVARVTAAALRNNAGEARRELETLSPDDRAAAQGWIEKLDAREAALAASRSFAAEAMAALAKPAP